MSRNTRLSFAAAALVATAACDVTRPIASNPLLNLRSVAADTNSANSILLHVQPDAPSIIQVVYWDDPDHRFTYRTSTVSADTTILVPQLSPGRVYQYDVTAINAAGVEGPATHGQIGTPPESPALQGLDLSAIGALTEPLVMLETGGTFTGFVAVNQVGEPVWHWATKGTPQGFTRRANGNFVFIDAGNGLFEVTPSGVVVHSLPPLANGDRAAHHDVVATPNNTLLFIAQERRTLPTSALGSTEVVGEAIWEWNPETNALDQRWSAFDFYDPAVDIGNRSTSSDWLHGNSLALGDHGNVILSLNWLSQVVSIAPDWKTLEWRIGGRNSSIVLDSAATFQGQHTAQVLPNGHLLVFDNGRDRTGAAQNSRAAEIAFDLKAGTGHLVWSFTPGPGQYDPFVGAARRLPNGNTLVFFGMHDGFAGATGPMAGYEVTPNGTIAWRITLQGGNITYRATPMASIAGETAGP